MNIALARQEHQTILSRLMTGPSDSDGAMHRAERVYGLGYWPQFNLRHKRRATVEFMTQVHSAFIASLESLVRRDLEILKIKQVKHADEARLASLAAEAERLLAEMEAIKTRRKGNAA